MMAGGVARRRGPVSTTAPDLPEDPSEPSRARVVVSDARGGRVGWWLLRPRGGTGRDGVRPPACRTPGIFRALHLFQVREIVNVLREWRGWYSLLRRRPWRHPGASSGSAPNFDRSGHGREVGRDSCGHLEEGWSHLKQCGAGNRRTYDSDSFTYVRGKIA